MNKPTNIIEQYFALQEEVFKYFGYVQDWKVIPLDPQMYRHWMICGAEDDSSTKIVYSDEPFTKESVEAGEKIYGGTIYTQRFLPKWVYRGEKYTMIAVDTHCDDNKMLMVFSNDKECHDQTLKDLYNQTW
jgi:phosphoribosyl-AMP cyclohydrolase